MTKVLITGASGFVGSYLVEQLLGRYEVFGTVFGSAASDTKGWTPVSLDLTNADAVYETVKNIRPDWVFHLAALSSPAASFKDNHKTLTNNILAQAYLLDALVEFSPHARILVVGSAEEYGQVGEAELPLDERHELRPLSPYAVSKVTQDIMSLQYHLSKGLDVVRVRPFNHIGPRQTPQFVVPAFAEQIAKIEKGIQEPMINVGNLTTTRDFTDVRDMVKAYELALLKGQSGDVYNIGSGVETSIQTILDTLLSLSQTAIEVRQDPERMLPSDTPRLRADAGKFIAQTGWQPSIRLEDTLADVLDYWRNTVRK